jgi:O-antigen ligase
MTTARSPSEIAAPWYERAQALLVLFPAAALAWPGPKAPLEGDPQPELTGAAIEAFAALPLLAIVLFRRAAPRAPWASAFLAFLGIGLVSLRLHPPTDTLQADRATLLAAVCLATLAGGATLGEVGRATLARALPLLSLLALAPGFLDAPPGWAGALGNTGSTSELAVLGAVAGAWLFARANGAWRWIGGAVALLHSVYCGIAPVLAGAGALAIAIACAALGRERRGLAIVLAALCALAFGAAYLGSALARAPFGGHPSQARATAPADAGGGSVRMLVWRSTASLVADHALLGVGPGQFAAAFPPYRDPREIEISSHGRTLPNQETEVEHAHNDFAQAFADAGVLGGLAWLAFLGAIVWRAWNALRERDLDRAALGLVALAAIANAFLREPLLWNPASASAAFGAFGALLASPPREGERSPARWSFFALAAAAVLIQLPRAMSVATHGRSLAGYLAQKTPQHLDFALDACPDSVEALSLRARAVERRAGSSSPETLAAWQAVLAVRPHRFEALVNAGIAYAEQERVDEARAAWTHAAVLDPANPVVPRNLARMEALIGDVAECERWLRRLDLAVPTMLRGYGFEALRQMRIERGWELLARADARFAGLSAQRAFDLAPQVAADELDRDRLALEGSAHVAWAREHATAGDAATAVRNYRQAKRCLNLRAEGVEPEWSPRLRLELAAALCLDGRLDDARAELEGVARSARDLAALPEWAGEALLRAGLLGT